MRYLCARTLCAWWRMPTAGARPLAKPRRDDALHSRFRRRQAVRFPAHTQSAPRPVRTHIVRQAAQGTCATPSAPTACAVQLLHPSPGSSSTGVVHSVRPRTVPPGRVQSAPFPRRATRRSARRSRETCFVPGHPAGPPPVFDGYGSPASERPVSSVCRPGCPGPCYFVPGPPAGPTSFRGPWTPCVRKRRHSTSGTQRTARPEGPFRLFRHPAIRANGVPETGAKCRNRGGVTTAVLRSYEAQAGLFFLRDRRARASAMLRKCDAVADQFPRERP